MAGQEESLPMLTLLVEVLSASDLPGSLDLISVLLDTLARTIGSVVAPQSDLIYVEQLLMTCVESAASQVKVRRQCSCTLISCVELSLCRKCRISLQTL